VLIRVVTQETEISVRRKCDPSSTDFKQVLKAKTTSGAGITSVIFQEFRVVQPR
jgi:hypothetical protein